jgi:Ca2+-binding EF-hand superfamily protein
MELREAFEKADIDGGGELDLEEFIEAFGDIIGKGMSLKQLRQLFMRIDADSNGTVEWHEFMNYMLLENETLLSMKEEHSEYIKTNTPDPAPHKSKFCHSDMITSVIIIPPDEENLSADQYARKMKYATSSRDGTVKVWYAHSMTLDVTI